MYLTTKNRSTLLWLTAWNGFHFRIKEFIAHEEQNALLFFPWHVYVAECNSIESKATENKIATKRINFEQ